jgi:hypothetical protein
MNGSMTPYIFKGRGTCKMIDWQLNHSFDIKSSFDKIESQKHGRTFLQMNNVWETDIYFNRFYSSSLACIFLC